MGERVQFDLTTRAGVDAAQAHLDQYCAGVDLCVTRLLLPWDLVLGRDQYLIDQARAALNPLPNPVEGGD